MHQLTMEDAQLVSGGEMNWPQAGGGLASIVAPIAIAGGPAVVGGHVTGVVAAGGITSTIALAEGGGLMVTGTAAAGGTVVGIGIVPVALVGAVAIGGLVLGNAIGNSDPVQNAAGAFGTWLGNHGIVW